MNAKIIFSFLEDLSKNNNRDWFHANKSRYEEAKKEFESFVNLIIPEIARFDKDIINLTAKDCLFRIYNDVRFAKNKPLYKTNFGAYIANGGKNTGHAGYYLHIEPGTYFLGGGIYMPPADKLKLIRKEIYYNYKEFEAILSSKSFKKYFNELEEIKISRVPKEFPKDFVGAEMLKYTSYTMLHSITKTQILSGDFKTLVIDVFKAMTPINHFINRAFYNSETE